MIVTFKLCVDLVLVEGSRAKVDQSQPARIQLHQKVLVLQIPMYHTAVVYIEGHVDHLTEEVARCRLRQSSSFGDVVEQVDRVVGSFKHQDEAVRPVVVVE